jgi:hypothetical protein
VFGVSVLLISFSYTLYEYTTASSPAFISSVNSSAIAVFTSAPISPESRRNSVPPPPSLPPFLSLPDSPLTSPFFLRSPFL